MEMVRVDEFFFKLKRQAFYLKAKQVGKIVSMVSFLG